MSHPLPDAKAKLDRAKAQIDELESAIRSLNIGDSKPYAVREYCEIKTKDWIYEVKVRRDLDPSIPCIIGDVLNNLRSALDYLIWKLANGSANDVFYFPIADGPVHLKTKLKTLGKRVSDDGLKLLCAAEPYKGGKGHGLWQLHHLNKREKHRLLVAAGAGHLNTSIDVATPLKSLGSVSSSYPQDPLILPAAKPKFPLVDGTVLLRLRPAAWSRDIGTDPKFAFYVALNEPQIIEAEPIVPTLTGLLKLSMARSGHSCP
jgi:hypothetical protein